MRSARETQERPGEPDPQKWSWVLDLAERVKLSYAATNTKWSQTRFQLDFFLSPLPSFLLCDFLRFRLFSVPHSLLVGLVASHMIKPDCFQLAAGSESSLKIYKSAKTRPVSAVCNCLPIYSKALWTLNRSSIR